MPNHKFSRREFARRVAVASAATLVPASVLATPPSAAHPVAPQQPPNLPKLSPESQAESDARLQSALAQYGSRLSDQQKSELGRLASSQQSQLDRLRAYKVENGDDPALYLKPLMEREKKPPSGGPAAPAGKPQTTPAPAAAKSSD
jgi:hypothetical protein